MGTGVFEEIMAKDEYILWAGSLGSKIGLDKGLNRMKFFDTISKGPDWFAWK